MVSCDSVSHTGVYGPREVLRYDHGSLGICVTLEDVHILGLEDPCVVAGNHVHKACEVGCIGGGFRRTFWKADLEQQVERKGQHVFIQDRKALGDLLLGSGLRW